jgi:putative folate metabolism gamma-glutamate ligase
MNCKAIKTRRVTANQITLQELINESIASLSEGSILAITSKIVSLCEGNIVPIKDTDKENLIKRESDYYLPASLSRYGHQFTIVNNTLIAVAGVDESNGDGNYILWPKNAQETANSIREYIVNQYGLKKFGVIVTDSTCQPFRRGTTGIVLAHSGFNALHDYVDTPDIFGRPLRVTKANIAGGIAAASVLVMGEGAEQTPLCIIEDVGFVDFQFAHPSPTELTEIIISPDDDLFAPFLNAVEWQEGNRHD